MSSLTHKANAMIAFSVNTIQTHPGLCCVDGFGALGKVSLPSQYDSQFTSGLPLPGAQLRPKINVGHTDMHL